MISPFPSSKGYPFSISSKIWGVEFGQEYEAKESKDANGTMLLQAGKL
jgi:hypothetical protein